MAAFSSGDMSTAEVVMTQAVDEADSAIARLILGGLAYAREDYTETDSRGDAEADGDDYRL